MREESELLVIAGAATEAGLGGDALHALAFATSGAEMRAHAVTELTVDALNLGELAPEGRDAQINICALLNSRDSERALAFPSWQTSFCEWDTRKICNVKVQQQEAGEHRVDFEKASLKVVRSSGSDGKVGSLMRW